MTLGLLARVRVRNTAPLAGSVRRRGLAAVGLALMLLDAAPVSARGVGRVLSDAELDSVFAQGLVVVNVSMSIKRIADRFDLDFVSETHIHTPDVAGPRGPAHANVEFLGGFVTIATEQIQSGGGSTRLVPASTVTAARNFGNDEAVSVTVQSSATNSAPNSNAATGATPVQPSVTVTFGGADAVSGNSVIAVSSKNLALDSQVSLVLRSINAAAIARATVIQQIRSSFGVAP